MEESRAVLGTDITYINLDRLSQNEISELRSTMGEIELVQEDIKELKSTVNILRLCCVLNSISIIALVIANMIGLF